MKRSMLSALAIAAAAVPGNAFAASTVTNMHSTLSAMPQAYRGGCPMAITFNGTITVNAKFDLQNPVLQISYQFLRSDNSTGPVSTYTIHGPLQTLADPGEKTLSDSWTFAGPSLHYSGWQQLKAWPTAHDGGYGFSISPKAFFTIDCLQKHKVP